MKISPLFTLLVVGCLISTLVIQDVDAKKKNKNKKNKNKGKGKGSAPKPDTPNILFFLIDDMGNNDVGYHDSSIHSPTIDKLAAEGMILDNNYVAPVCTPSRGSILTGKYSWAIGQQHDVPMPDWPECLTKEYPLLPESLQELGYKTFMLGKWHEGFCNLNCTPNHRGFDEFYGFYNGFVSHFTHTQAGYYDWHDNEEVDMASYGQYAANLLGDRAIKNINDHAKNNPSDPFYMYFASTTVHSPMEAPGKYLEMYSDEQDFERKCLKAMVTVTDDIIASIVQALKKNDLYDNTVIIFTSDNGGEAGYSSNYPFRGAKATIWEGGVHVPGFIHSPLLKESAGTVAKGLFHETDWYPTIMKLAGSEAYDAVDGYDQTDFLFHGGESARTVVPLHYDQYYMPCFGKSAIRSGKWKLIEGFPGLYNGYDTVGEGPDMLHFTHESEDLLKRSDKVITTLGISFDKRGDYNFDFAAIGAYSAKVATNVMLFDLEADPTETTDLSAQYPDIVAQLQDEMKTYSDQAVARSGVQPDPAANPHHYGGVWTPGWCGEEAFLKLV